MRKSLLLLIFLIGVLTLIKTGYQSLDLNESRLNLPQYNTLNREHKKEIDCLTQNIYREASGENYSGMTAVALVTMNRVATNGFPETVCKVVKQKTKRVCQFSWTCMHRLPSIDSNIYSYSRYVAIRVFFNHDIIEDITLGALFYHADYVNPRWNKFEVTTKIGRHIFYKPGDA